MPRTARIKNNESINYIIVKGITDVPLFREEEDKQYYLSLISKFKSIYGFKLYAYCIMQDYAHFIIDLCGADISNIMSSINVGYSVKYNRKYNRHGHLFNDRFRSKIVLNELELKALTLYIHNSPTEIKEYTTQPWKYIHSSLGSYMGFEDPFHIVDEKFIEEFVGDNPESKGTYMEQVLEYDANRLIEDIETNSIISNSKYYTKSLTPEISPDEILDFVSTHTGISRLKLCSRYAKDAKEQRALTAFIMKNFCHYKTSDICKALDTRPSNSISNLFYTGFKLVEENEAYSMILDEFKKKYIG